MNKNLSFLCSVGLILTAAIWGFAFVIVKDSLDYIGPYWMVAIRFFIASVCLSVIFLPRFKKMNKSILIHGIFLGIFLGIAYIVQTVGCKYTTAGKNAFLTTIYVILVPILSWPVLKTKPKWFVFLAAFLSVTGIGLLALNGEGSGWYKMNVGDVLTLICGLFYALHIIYGAKYVSNDDVFLITIVQFVVAAILGLFSALFFKDDITVKILTERKVVISLLYLGLLSSMLCFVLQNVGLKYVPSSLASLFLSLESVFGVIFSTIFLKEHLSTKMTVGCILIFSAILIAEVFPGLLDKSSKGVE